MSFKNELKDVWVKEKEYLDEIDPVKDKELYKAQLDRVTEIEKRLTDLEKADIEADSKYVACETEANIKRDQMEDEKKNQKSRNRIEVAKIAVPISAAFVMGIVSMVWEKTDVLTSTAGKASWRDLIKFRS